MATDIRSISFWTKKFAIIVALGVCLLTLSSQRLFAQVDEGSISGTVRDTTGAIIPGATVVLTNTGVGLKLETKSSSGGEYTFSPVRIGNYTITVTAAGFSKTVQENLTVNVSQSLQVNVDLKAGAANETVEVNTAPPQLQTEEASVGQVVTEATVNALPLNGRNFTFLAQLGAGTQTPQADTRGNAASGAFSANGLRPSQNNYLLDGIDNNSNAVDFLNGTNFIVLPPVDAVQEFKVQTADFSAELGRSAGAVLNATIKSGTNSIHGAAWEFFRNDKLDAKNYFDQTKGELRLNQFGGSFGGPIKKDKIFVFGDYEGLRRVSGLNQTGSVPTPAEVSSGYQNLTDILNAHSGTQTDILGRVIPKGTVVDPATTRFVAAGGTDPVSGLQTIKDPTTGMFESGYVRDPFGTCSASTTTYTAAACGLNQLPAGRIDPVALKLLTLYPAANNSKLSSNYSVNPNIFEHRNAFDVRGDYNPSQRDQLFVRVSYVDDPQFIPGIFGGVADGGGFQQGLQGALSTQSAAAYTHTFSPSMVNVGRVGFNHLHTTRYGPEGGSSTDYPTQYGIQGISQGNENGGLPSIAVGGLQTLGSNAFLPSDEISQTLQITDDFTKIFGKHSFKTGIEFQHVKFSTLQPAFSRGNFDYNGQYTDVPAQNNGGTGLAQFLISPKAFTITNGNAPPAGYTNGLSFSGGADGVNASNINKTYDAKNYFAGYLQDDWKVTPRLTINLGIRYDYFGPIQETNGAQANFVESGPPNGIPTFIIPSRGKADQGFPANLSASFVQLLAMDNIALLKTDKYGLGLVQNQKANIVPRIGFAYQVNPKLVIRGGFGLFYNSFENQGYGPNIGENYPFVYNFSYSAQTAGTNSGEQGVSPVSYNTPFGTSPTGGVCPTAGPGGTASIASGLSCLNFAPTQVNASGLGLQGIQFNYKTPQTLSSNFTTQYSITRTISAQVSYVYTKAEHLQAGVGNNNVSAILPANASTTNAVPFPDFGHGGSYQRTIGTSNYNGLQTKLEQQYSNGLSFLLAYTYSKTLGDAGDLLNGGSSGGYRAPSVPGLGPSFDYTLADFDIRHVIHFSGGYELPVGKDKKFLNNSNKLVDGALGGWAVNTIVTAQGGQPITLSCPDGTAAGLGCYVMRVPGQSQKLGIHHDANGVPNFFGNPAAFTQPCPIGATGPAGCVTTPETSAILGGTGDSTHGPGIHQVNFSAFKTYKIDERFSLQFRSEFFNLLNHPDFNAPNFGGNGVVSIGGSGNYTDTVHFGEIGSTRVDNRQIQFALKLYY